MSIPATSPLGLTSTQLDQFRRNGFLHIPSVLPPSTISTLLSTTSQLLSSIDLSTHPLTRFTTGDSSPSSSPLSSPSSPTSASQPPTPSTTAKPHIGDDYFLSSGDKIRYFFEDAAFSPATPTSPSSLLHPPSESINKIGHSLHTLSPPFRALTLSATNLHIARSIGFHNPLVLQSMVICKQPTIGGRVPPHQDSTFLYTNPPSAVGWWYALEDAGRGNGGLWFQKGSHLTSAVEKRFVRLREGGTGFVALEKGESAVPADGMEYVLGCGDGSEGGDRDWELVEVRDGGLVLIHGNVLHKSERNVSAEEGRGRSRWAYTFHVIEGEGEGEGGEVGCIYDGRNWLQPAEGGFSCLNAVEGDD